MWALDWGAEASKPFATINLQTFSLATKFRVSSSVNVDMTTSLAGRFLPFLIDFSPFTEVPAPRMVKVAELRRLQGGGSTPLADDAEEGSVSVTAPIGFSFQKAEFGACIDSVLEIKGRPVWNYEDVFTSAQVNCLVSGPTDNILTMVLLAKKYLKMGTVYRIRAKLKNPLEPMDVMPWSLDSYKKYLADGRKIRMDSMSLPGIRILPKSTKFIVENDSREYMGMARVRQVNVTVQFKDPIFNGDSIRILAPTRFNLTSPDSGGGSNISSCYDFQWVGSYRPLLNSPLPRCECELTDAGVPQCSLVIAISESADMTSPVLVAESRLDFLMSLINPSERSDVIDDWWTVEHLNGSNIAVAGNYIGSCLDLLSVYFYFIAVGYAVICGCLFVF
ncbi:unnamed protein product [Polarella glacialis]|uniref:Uncharacterized protein n=1 Tax=Polarella glacialis TaxID=89957 RepID=A0A813G0Y2_POLGL|nr:unnamed protein product [Polarella glacialis]